MRHEQLRVKTLEYGWRHRTNGIDGEDPLFHKEKWVGKDFTKYTLDKDYKYYLKRIEYSRKDKAELAKRLAEDGKGKVSKQVLDKFSEIGADR